jgi:tRNA uridine 5-carbamoylmethylation protein Kti12
MVNNMDFKTLLRQERFNRLYEDYDEPTTKEQLQKLYSDNSPKIIILIGLPGSGKSTFINHYLTKKKALIASTDNIIELRAKKDGITYSEAFNKYDFKEIDREMRSRIAVASKKNEDIIIDQTNMSDKSRVNKMNLVPKTYVRYAIVFWAHPEILKDRLEKRAKDTGKFIPDKVINQMLVNYVPPSASEGYKDIILISYNK